jgi:nitrogen regulatory protein P-II 1
VAPPWVRPEVEGEIMKRVEAIIKPYKLEDVKEALQRLDIKGMTISEVRGFGRQKGHNEFFRAAEYTVDFTPKIQLELILEDAQVPQVLKVIQESARIGTIGDGNIFVTPEEEVIRIRTGESGAGAI